MGKLNKYLKFFENHDGYEEFTGSTEYIKPNVSRCEEEKHVHYGPNNRPTAITFVETAITINLDDKELQLEPIIEPADVKNKTLMWITNNPNIATVDSDGKVTLNKVGRCTIIASTPDGKVKGRCFINCIRIMPERIELNKNILYMTSGETYQLSASIVPSEAYQGVNWSSSNPSLVSVDSSGLVTALALEGESIVTAASEIKPTLTATCSVSLVYVPVTGVSFAESAVTLGSGETLQLEAIVEPEDASFKGVTWQSSDPSVVSVDENGLITANQISGDAVVTVTTNDQGLTAACNVHIEFIEVTGVTLNSYRAYMHSGGTKQLTSMVWPSNATIKDVTWSTSDSGVCTVDNTGFVTVVSTGECIITVTSVNGNKTAECNVKVAKDHSTEYFTIVANEPSEIMFSRATLSYSLDGGGTWTPMSTSSTIATLQAGDEMLLKGTAASDNQGIGSFSGSTGNFSIKGNFMSLIYGDNFEGKTAYDDNHKNYTFATLFGNTSGGVTALTNAEDSVLIAEKVYNYSYSSMFRGCVNLKTPPEMMVVEGATRCFYNMFNNCTSLEYPPQMKTTNLAEAEYAYAFNKCTNLKWIPELPNVETIATDAFQYTFYQCTSIETIPEDLLSNSVTVASGGCSYMFNGCTSIKSIPSCLPATTINRRGYEHMFSGCRMEKAPIISATTIADYAMDSMFAGCALLKKAPKLPATTLAINCYEGMFRGCSGLTEVPEDMLPATALTNYCYHEMFRHCTGLTEVPDQLLPATNLANWCYAIMFGECYGLTKTPTLLAQTLVDSCYHSMFYNDYNLKYVKCLATNISATNCTKEWLNYVASSGTFVTPASTSWSSGGSGIPSGWTRTTP